MHATLYRVIGSNRDMDDLIQDTFIEVFRSLPRFRGEAKLSTWIDRITVRVAYAYFGRRRPAAVSLELLGDAPSDDAPGDDRAHAREGVRRLYAALAGLGANARLAFALHAIDGRPIAEWVATGHDVAHREAPRLARAPRARAPRRRRPRARRIPRGGDAMKIPPVDPLSDARWDRIERRLLDRERDPIVLTRPRRFLYGIAFAATVAAAAILFVVLRPAAPPFIAGPPIGVTDGRERRGDD